MSFKSWIQNGSINFNDIKAFAKDRGLINIFNPDPIRFPGGGFKYEYSSGKFCYTIHGHGIDPSALAKFPESNTALGPTVSIARKPMAGGRQEHLMSNRNWKKRRSNLDFDKSHIPLNNLPCK